MEEDKYLSNYSNEQVEKMLERLAPNQRKIYQRLLGEYDQRKALWLASSWPMEDE